MLNILQYNIEEKDPLKNCKTQCEYKQEQLTQQRPMKAQPKNYDKNK